MLSESRTEYACGCGNQARARVSIVRSKAPGRATGGLTILALVCVTLCVASAASAACIDLKQTNVLSFEGTLSYRIFAGPPNYEDVRKGDTPEPTYILMLAQPICASGDEFVDPGGKFNLVQIFPGASDEAARALSKDLRRLVGKRVLVEGTSPFGAHTGHHHAPLMLPITRISIASTPRNLPARR
jgi:Domain of unknown function (DUF4431)